jgi:MFS family permease
MYLLSLYFQDPASLGFSPLEAGLATLPATVGLVLVAPLVPKLAKKFGGRQVIGAGFVIMTAGFAAIGLADASWVYLTFLLPLIAIAMGMGLSNGPSSSAATASVPEEQVGEASGVSNMARYVGAAVATALAATVYSTVTDNQRGDGASAGAALASGLAAAAWVMVVFSALGILLALVAIRRHRAAQGTVADAAASAAAHLHTLPTTASRAPAPVPGDPGPSEGASS